jgi:hypothetical protein
MTVWPSTALVASLVLVASGAAAQDQPPAEETESAETRTAPEEPEAPETEPVSEPASPEATASDEGSAEVLDSAVAPVPEDVAGPETAPVATPTEAAPTPPAPVPASPSPTPATAEPAPEIQLMQPIEVAANESFVDDLLPIWIGERWTAWRLLVLLLLTVFFTWLVRVTREGLPEAGLIPRGFRVLHILLRLWAFAVGLALLAAILEPSFGTAFPWVLLAAAVALGWSVRDVLPDVSAFAVLLFERRVRRGVWISGEGFAGIVDRRGLRAVWIRDGCGHRLSIPNHLLLRQPVTWQLEEGTLHEVALRFESRQPAWRTRSAIRDAVLTSPWVRPDADAEIRRDGIEPDLWHVRAKLLDLRFAMRFEGDLLERAEDILSASPGPPIDDDQH